MAFDLSTAKPAQNGGGFDLNTARPVNAPEQSNSLGSMALEGMAAFNRGATNMLDFFTTDQINAIMQLAGSDKRVPSITDATSAGTAGNFMQDGLAKDAIRTGGEFIAPAVLGGATLNAVASNLPASQAGNASRAAAASAGARTATAPVVAPTESTLAGTVRQIGAPAPLADLGYGFASGAGAEVGREQGGESGALVGAIAAPLGIAGFRALLSGGVSMGKNALANILRSTDEMGEEGAARLLAEAAAREGLSPDDVVKRLQALGSEGLPADVGPNFARLLRTASNMSPGIEGAAGRQFAARHAGQADRIAGAFQESALVPKQSADEVIAALEARTKPAIDALYREAGKKPLPLSGKLRSILEGKNSASRARKAAELRLADKRAVGDEITHFDIINATKQELDDQIGTLIRQGKNNKARDLIRLKNDILEEADKAIPKYKEARQLFAGKADLESAADLGKNFFKLSGRDVRQATRNMTENELKMFRLGARDAVFDRLDDLQMNRDAVKAMFGKRGDAEKLRHVFPDEQEFRKFAEVMQREADFVMTRRAAQGNSSTAKQLFDQRGAEESLEAMRSAAGDPVAAASLFQKIMAGLGAKRGTEANVKALEQAGDFLLAQGIKPERVVQILRRGNAKELEAVFREVLPAVGSPTSRASGVAGSMEASSTPRTSDKWGLTIRAGAN